jgi:MFS family permease
MVDLRLFRDSLFSVSLLTGFMVFVVIAGMFILPFYLERVKGYDTQETGLLLTVFPVALGLLAPVAGVLSDRYGPRGISLIGLAIFGGACLSMAALKESTSVWQYTLYLLPVGIGAGIFQSPNNSAIMGAAPREQLGVVSGLLSLSRTFGQVTGLPLIGAIYASRVLSVSHVSPGTSMDAGEAPPWAIVQGLHTAFIASAVLIAVGVLLAGYAFVVDWRRRSQTPEIMETAR